MRILPSSETSHIPSYVITAFHNFDLSLSSTGIVRTSIWFLDYFGPRPPIVVSRATSNTRYDTVCMCTPDAGI